MSQSCIQPTNEQPTYVDTSKWPLLLRNYTSLILRDGLYSPLPCGNSPLKRPYKEHLKYGVIHLDKPSNPSSHEIVSWVKRILQVEKTGHSGTLDPLVTGCLIICIERATRIAKAQQTAGKQYVALLELDGVVEQTELEKAIKFFIGKLYQLPPKQSAVSKTLRIRQIYDNKLIEYDPEQRLALMRVDCEAGTYIRVLCKHIGYYLGVGGRMAELRRTRSGTTPEDLCLVTMHDVLDAKYLYDKTGDDSYMRRVVRPLEWMLRDMKRIVVKDSAVDAICHGAPVAIPGVMRYDGTIETGENLVVITTKGEAIALCIAQMSAEQISQASHGAVAKIKRVIMDRGTYSKCWSKGPVALEKKRMIREGLLDEHGKPNEKTPPNWLRNFLSQATK